MLRNNNNNVKLNETYNNQSEAVNDDDNTEQIIAGLKTIFENLDLLIINFLQHNQKSNQQEIGSKFGEILNLLGELEIVNEGLFKSYKYDYHIKQSSYLTAIGKVDEARKHEQIAKKYKVLPRVTVPDLNNNDKNQNVDEKFFSVKAESNNSFANVATDTPLLESMFEKLGVIVADDAVKKIKSSFYKMDNCNPRTAIDYINIEKDQSSVKNLLDEICIELGTAASFKKNLDINFIEEINKAVYALIEIVSYKAHNLEIKFIKSVLSSPNPEQTLYGDVLHTKENIFKRCRDISYFFHPDRNKLRGKDKKLAEDVFYKIQECRDKLLERLAQESHTIGEFNSYKEKADDAWQIALDFRYALQGKWDRLISLKREDLVGRDSDELDKLRLQYLRLAYENYRACCKIADESSHSQINSTAAHFRVQIELRRIMSLCLYSLGHFLEAQLYALAAIKLIFKNSEYATDKDLNEAKKVFDKVRGISDEQLDNEAAFEENLSNTQILANINEKALIKYSSKEIKDIRSSIDKGLAIMANKLMIKSDRGLINYQSPQEEILRAKKNGNTHKVVGVGVMGSGIAIGTVAAGNAAVEILQGVGVIAGSTIGGPAVAIAAGVATIGLGIYFGASLWKKGNLILEEPEIRNCLNAIMVRAINYYDRGQHQEFIQELAVQYTNGSKLLSLDDPHFFIDPTKIIDTLLLHGFRPDGIAYLLNSIGEALASRRIKINGLSQSDLINKAQQVFDTVLSKKLMESSNQLDNRIKELRRSSIKGRVNTITDRIFLKDYTDIAKDHINDAQEMPFKARLEEMVNVARINLTIIRIMRDNAEEYDFAKNLIKEVRNSVESNYQFTSKAKIRIETLENFLWVVSGEIIKVETIISKDKVVPMLQNDKNDLESYIKYLNKIIASSVSIPEKITAYNHKVVYYKTLAEEWEKKDHLISLKYWEECKNNYSEILRLDAKQQSAAIGFGRCLSKLSKHDQVITFLSENRNLHELVDYWIIGSIAYQKKNNYQKAKEWIIEALRISPQSQEADKQLKIIDSLLQKDVYHKIESYKKADSKTLRHNDEDYFAGHHKAELPYYKILSIDGGGIRGILPAMWLSEIECRIKRPISHVFNMASGTSTGGIIAAGISVPFINEVSTSDGIEYVPSRFIPRYKASDILALYTEKPKEIFTKSVTRKTLNFFNDVVTTTYTEYGRKTLFNQYFGNTELKDSLIDLVIPAVNNSKNHTHLFTREDSRRSPDENETYVNALMATSAAPTFFPEHTIPGKGIFSDGGVHVNNPSMNAYSIAKKSIPGKEIFLLSMGTGSYVPDPIKPNLHNGLLFWGLNIKNVAFAAQEGNTDRDMHSHLGERYHRWQAMMENPIQLDASEQEDIKNLLEMGRQYLEEMYASDENRMNKVLEFLDNECLKDEYTSSYGHTVGINSI